VDHVGLRDNLFDLGGNSLLAVRIVHRIETELGYEISMTQMFEYPTVAALADLLGRMTPASVLATAT